ncbi:hypothetical protein CNMCM5793_000112 [Aspergillus hiratsukae]|uniref:DUF7732 domain-containing protein n=1 Tax=Aspergillus hiratsukae TaxID=1194566 RepID=A0A8H6P976_9EURO|nr:hypothetical protein CNMCM5793_000112 [Aspergillus hiratsukae]KAF7161009.1 hypothetical protein CNMCM6106_008347 [Aspergillus hiratsukae]
MKIAYTTVLLFLLSSTTVTTYSIPQSDLVARDALALPVEPFQAPDLEKRRGGGGGGRGGGSGGSGGGRSGSGGSSGSSGSSGSRGGSGGSSRTGSTSSTSRIAPSYAGGAYYAGGAASAYSAGRRSPLGITPFLLPVAALAIFPGIWLYGAYAYPYSHHYNYINQTANRNESLPVVCLCQQYSACGCDDNNNSTYYQSLFNGTQPVNSSIAKVVNANGTETIYINGTLPNATTTSTGSTSSAPATTLLEASGYWVMVALVVSTVWAL